MGKIQYILSFLLLGSCFVILSCGTQKKAHGDQETTAELMKTGIYVFEAQRAIAQNGFNKVLTSDYDLSVSIDTVKAWLPYFGRAYQAPMDPSEGGIHFTSTDFTYSIDENEKKGWDVKIVPHDQRNVEHMTLSVSPAGYATLHVISLHRQPISFYGRIADRP